MVTTKRPARAAAETPLTVVKRLLGAASETDVLVGGQALAMWIVKYGLQLPPDLPVVTRNTAFLTQSAAATAPVERFAQAINGKATFPRRLDMTALVGQVELAVSDTTYINVDVIFQLIGLDRALVPARAVRVELTGATTFLVMHPLDVLKSRLANLHALREKQNDKGVAQLRLSIFSVGANTPILVWKLGRSSENAESLRLFTACYAILGENCKNPVLQPEGQIHGDERASVGHRSGSRRRNLRVQRQLGVARRRDYVGRRVSPSRHGAHASRSPCRSAAPFATR